jgi:hypothetical protein
MISGAGREHRCSLCGSARAMAVRVAIAAAFGAVGLALALSLSPAAAADSAGTRKYVVNPGAWTHTGIQMQKGRSASITGTGTLYHTKEGPKSAWGPGGYYLIGFQNYDLKAKVGKQIVDIGASGSIFANDPGELLVGAGRAYDPNPADAGTISGHFDVTVFSSAITADTPGGAGGGPDPPWALGTMAGLGSAAAGAAAAGAGHGQGRPKGRRGPCAQEQDRMAAAGAAARSAQMALGLANSVRNMLEAQRENARESGYWSGVNWVGWAAGGMAGGPAASFLSGVVESATKGMAGEVMNQFSGYCLDQGFDLSEVMRQTAGVQKYGDGTYAPSGGGAAWPFADKVKELFVNWQTSQYLQKTGLDPKGPVAAALKQTFSNSAGTFVNALGNAFSAAGFVSGVRDSINKLADFDRQISLVRDQQFQAETARDQALQEMDLARSALNYCIQLHPEEAA